MGDQPGQGERGVNSKHSEDSLEHDSQHSPGALVAITPEQRSALDIFKRGRSLPDLNQEEQYLYTALFEDIKRRYLLDAPEDLMMLDRALYNYFLASKGGGYLQRMGLIVKDAMKQGENTKSNPVFQIVANADKRFMEFMDKLKLSRFKRESGEMSSEEKRDMKIIISRLKKVTEVKESVVGTTGYRVVEATPSSHADSR